MPRYVVNPIADHEGCHAGVYDNQTGEFVALVCEGHSAAPIAALFNNPSINGAPTYIPFKQVKMGQQFYNLDGKLFIRIDNDLNGGPPSVENTDPFDRFIVNAIALEDAADERGRLMKVGQVLRFKDNEAIILDYGTGSTPGQPE